MNGPTPSPGRGAARSDGAPVNADDPTARRATANSAAPPTSPESGAAARPTLPDRYCVIAPLGRGGMAVVHRAHDRTLDRMVAVKLLPEDAETDTEGRARFRREAQTVAQITHPNVVRVYDAGPGFLVMELVPGGPLKRATPELLEKVARGVQAAHERGIVHRDLKPSNVLLDAAGEPKVSDFGLAHLAGEHTRLTRDGAVFGTPRYMAPEQVEGRVRQVTPRTDVWALGAMLYEALAGAPPFPGNLAMEVFGKITHADPVPPSRLAPGVSADLETIALKALEKDPLRRYPDAGAFAEDLRRQREGEPISARPPSGWERLRRRLVRRRTALAAAAAGLAALVLTLSFLLPTLAGARRALHLWRDVSVILADADLYARSGELDRARARIEEGLALCREHDSAESGYFQGRLLRARGDEAEALRRLDDALERNPRLGEARLERGLLYAERYDRALARGLWRFAGRTPDDEPLAPEECEQAAGAGGLREQAIADLSAPFGESAYFRPVDALFGRAELARIRWQWAEAEAGLQEVIARDPLHARAWLSRATIAYLRGDFAAAENACAQALAKHRGLGAAWRTRSQALFWMAQRDPRDPRLPERLTRSRADAEEAIRLGEPAFAARGNARLRLGDTAGAREDYDRALDLEPRDALTWNHRGLLRLQGGEAARAVEDFSRAVAIAPAFGRAWANRALAHAALAQPALAAADARRALEVASPHAAWRDEMDALLSVYGEKK